LHQILPKAWRYPSENHSQDPTGFRGRCHEHLTHKGVVHRFKDGRTFVDSEPHPGWPSTSQNDNVIDQVWTLVMQDRRITVRELAIEVGISTGSVHSILAEDLGLKRVSTKFVPRLLTMEQKQLCLEIARDMLGNANSDPNFLNTVIAGDETWVYGYDPEKNMQSSQWKHP
jgi:histone-lysine N-methyltransferase SETMAR